MKRPRSLRNNWVFSLLMIFIFIDGNLFLLPQKIQQTSPSIIYKNEIAPNSQDDPTPIDIQYPKDYRNLHFKNTIVKHHWILVDPDFKKNSCHIYMTDEAIPGDEDILGFCNLDIYFKWAEQQECLANSSETCSDISIQYVSEIDEKLDRSITMPGPAAYAKLSNCPAWGACEQTPELTFGASEPLQSQQIDSLFVIFENGEYMVCNSYPCTLVMPTTGYEAIKVQFYASSSYGDFSFTYDFYMRNYSTSDGGFLFQIMGNHWWKEVPAALAQWRFFPEPQIENIQWLRMEVDLSSLATEHDYAFLAGKLILRGTVKASDCVNGGLLANGAANACGLIAAKEQNILIQNSLDTNIIDAAAVSRVPPRLLKGLIGQESQFWNGWVIKGEYGYGMLTDNGADMLLTWNVSYFLEVCIPVYGEDKCGWGYSYLSDFQKSYLRGLALLTIGTDKEIEVIGQTLAAATGQTGQIIRNITNELPGDIAKYEDLWMISLAIYSGGPGCVGAAIEAAWAAKEPLSWLNIAEYLKGDCQQVATYPQNVINYTK